jgi:hypothetical protein
MKKLNELEQHLDTLKADEQLEVIFQKKRKDRTPPFISVGNGKSSKSCPEDRTIDAFETFAQLSRAQQILFIELKDILIEQNLDNHYAKRKVENPNLVNLQKKMNPLHQSIRTRMSQNRNRKTLERKGVLKQVKPGQYVLNPYLFIPAHSFEKVAQIWKELPT